MKYYLQRLTFQVNNISMSAQANNLVGKASIYYHIYNKGVEGKAIFNSKEDSDVFISFLKDYLSTKEAHETVKKSFTVRGRAFTGTPHQPKNYVGKVELLAYSISSDHYHLVLRELSVNSLGSFMQSLATRYSIYFNKKYLRAGSVFSGPYKSIGLTDSIKLTHLIAYVNSHGVCSNSTYLGTINSDWIKKVNTPSDYKAFINGYKFDNEEEELMSGLLFDLYESSIPQPDLASKPDLASDDKYHTPQGEKQTVKANEKILIQESTTIMQIEEPILKLPQFIAIITVILALLIGLGVKHIQSFEARLKINKIIAESFPSGVLGQNTEQAALNKKLVVRTNSKSAKVNIRENPDNTSNIVDKATDGDVFDYLSEQEDWYEVAFLDGRIGFISKKYIEVIQTD